ncbi:MAG: hypothetical protein JST54_26605 [Deltaproteobacteria bacterium]|nr:hypothetical protein [Deltaproteobacteria bacterium]
MKNAVPRADDREAFWRQKIELPAGLALVRGETTVVPQVGQAGELVLDWATLRSPTADVQLLIVFRPSLLARDVPRLKERITAVAEERRRRDAAIGKVSAPIVPALATSVALPSIVDSCLSEGVALVDQRGTVIAHSGPVYVHVVGHGHVERAPRTSFFSGKGCRIVRLLLSETTTTFTAQAIAARTQTSYVHAHGVLSGLERQGFVARTSTRSGFHVRDAGALLRAWMKSPEKTAIALEAYNAPSTEPNALQSGLDALRVSGGKGIFTLASGLSQDELFVSGLPHALYVSGESQPLVETLGLRKVTPHNFLVLRAEASAETEAGGIYLAPRPLPHGPGVFLPQLIVDLAKAGGRGPEQAEFLLERFLKALPFRGDSS